MAASGSVGNIDTTQQCGGKTRVTRIPDGIDEKCQKGIENANLLNKMTQISHFWSP